MTKGDKIMERIMVVACTVATIACALSACTTNANAVYASRSNAPSKQYEIHQVVVADVSYCEEHDGTKMLLLDANGNYYAWETPDDDIDVGATYNCMFYRGTDRIAYTHDGFPMMRFNGFDNDWGLEASEHMIDCNLLNWADEEF